jgi:hypothetical protein
MNCIDLATPESEKKTLFTLKKSFPNEKKVGAATENVI